MHLTDMAAVCRPCSLPEGSRHISIKTGHMHPVCAGMGRRFQEQRIKHLQWGLSLEPPLQGAQDAQTWAVLQGSECILHEVEKNIFLC